MMWHEEGRWGYARLWKRWWWCGQAWIKLNKPCSSCGFRATEFHAGGMTLKLEYPCLQVISLKPDWERDSVWEDGSMGTSFLSHLDYQVQNDVARELQCCRMTGIKSSMKQQISKQRESSMGWLEKLKLAAGAEKNEPRKRNWENA